MKKESQQATIREKKKKLLYFTLFASPDYTYQMLGKTTHSPHLLDSKLLLQEEHNAAYSVSQGAET